MNRILDDILSHKRAQLPSALARRAAPVDIAPIPFREALAARASRREPAIIAEIKRGSPSRGIIVGPFEPALIAREYADGGAAALSVLTEETFFFGSPENIQLAKQAATLPTLCKDFFIEPEQMRWARDTGADAALLIVRILSDSQMRELLLAAAEAGLDVLVETHDEKELDRALDCGCDLIGVNNRDLDTFQVDLEVSIRLAPRIPPGVVAVAESGIHTREDVLRLSEAGYGAFLVGESLITADERTRAVRELLGETTR